MRAWMTVVAAMSASLAGCGGGDVGGDLTEGATTISVAARPEVVVHVSGAYSGTFESTGSIFCTGDEFGGPDEGFELYAMKIPEQFNLKMPRNTLPGRYSTSDGSGAAFNFYYTDPQRVKYNQIETATIQLESVPQAQGERLIGNIIATLQKRRDENQIVNVEVQLNLAAGAQSFDECE